MNTHVGEKVRRGKRKSLELQRAGPRAPPACRLDLLESLKSPRGSSVAP